MLKASSQQNNVGKGSRQLRSVTSGKGLAPRLHAGVGGDRVGGSGEEWLREALSGATRGSLSLPLPSPCCAYNEAATWNCYEQGESNWLIKPQVVCTGLLWLLLVPDSGSGVQIGEAL